MTAPVDLDAIEARAATWPNAEWGVIVNVARLDVPAMAAELRETRARLASETAILNPLVDKAEEQMKTIDALRAEVANERRFRDKLLAESDAALEKAQAEAGRYRDVLEQALVDLSLLVDPPCGVLDMVEAALAKVQP